MFQLSQIQCFVAVAYELHFGKAAKLLNMTQPPLTRQIKLLELELGVQLLDRSSKHVKLTYAGKVFLPEAEYILQLCKELTWKIQQAALGYVGSTILGFIPAVGYGLLPQIMTKAKELSEEFNIVFKEMLSVDQIRALRSKQLDLGIIRHYIEHRGIRTCCILKEPFILALPGTHPLCGQAHIHIRSLHRENFIMYPPVEGRDFYTIITAMFQSENIHPTYVQYLTQMHSILSLVSFGLGVALVPESCNTVKFDNVVFREVTFTNPLYAELYLAWREDNENTRLIEMIKSTTFSFYQALTSKHPGV
jgi:DNA-binding transcriptional LysR family regulator